MGHGINFTPNRRRWPRVLPTNPFPLRVDLALHMSICLSVWCLLVCMHGQRSDLLLTYHTSMPGYSGYCPKGAKPRDLSNCPLTSQGAAALGLML
jgi:hypothetical protein